MYRFNICVKYLCSIFVFIICSLQHSSSSRSKSSSCLSLLGAPLIPPASFYNALHCIAPLFLLLHWIALHVALVSVALTLHLFGWCLPNCTDFCCIAFLMWRSPLLFQHYHDVALHSSGELFWLERGLTWAFNAVTVHTISYICGFNICSLQ